MKRLYVSHTATISGGERSLLDLLAADSSEAECVLASPAGPLSVRANVRIAELPPIDATLNGDLLHGVRSIVRAAHVLRRIVQIERPDVVHANSIRAGVIAAIARLDVPLIVSVRDVLPDGGRTVLTRRLIHRRAALVIANSEYSALHFQGSAPTMVLYPGVELSRLTPELLPSVAEARKRLGLSSTGPVLGVIGQLTPWKAQDDAIRLLAALRRGQPNAVLLIVGAATFARATFDNLAYERDLHELARALGVDDAVHFLGERADVPTIIRALDVLLAPSWHEPFGRTIVEALAVGVPVASTNVGGPAEILAGTDSRLLPPGQPDPWVAAVEDLLDPVLRSDVAVARRQATAERFSVPHHVEQLLSAYESVVGGDARASLGAAA